MRNYDELICRLFINEKNKLKGRRTAKICRYPNIKEYLDNRYEDSESYAETIRRIQYHIEIRPVCKECGGHVKYLGGINNFFQPFCSTICSKGSELTKEKNRETCLKKYGVPNGGGSKQALEKIKQTCQQKYGVNNVFHLKEVQEKKKKTTLEHYGVECNLSAREIRENIKRTCIEKYGISNGGASKQAQEKIKQTCQQKYGVNNVFYLTKYHYGKYQEKRYQTMRKNKSFTTSKPEEELYLYIKEKFPLVERQYKCNRYPWRCDFYIPELDLFLELQGNWTHGKHAYNPDSIEDQEILQEWKTNSKEHPYYNNAIKTWSMYDVKKRETAEHNNLNYHEFWKLKEAKMFIDSL